MDRESAAGRSRKRWLARAIRASGPAFFLLIIGAAFWARQTTVQTIPAPGEWRTFEGSLNASGTRTSLDMGSEHRASVFHLSGSVLLTGDNGLGVGFRAEFVGFTDTRSGMVGRALWTDARGDHVFSDLKGEWVGTGNRITGTFVGGTGRYTNTAGEYEFQWQYVLEAEDGAVSGRATGLKGRAQVNAPPAGGPGK